MVIMLPYSAKPSSTANPLFLLCVSNIGALCKDNRQGKTSILWTYVLYCIVVSCYIVLLLHGPPNSGIPWETKPNYYYDMWNWIRDAQLLMWHNDFLVIICEVHALVVSISECEKRFWNYVYIQKVKMNFLNDMMYILGRTFYLDW